MDFLSTLFPFSFTFSFCLFKSSFWSRGECGRFCFVTEKLFLRYLDHVPSGYYMANLITIFSSPSALILVAA
jgi:hypothetical protein